MRFRISKSKYENWRSGISNGRTKTKFVNYRNHILVFQIKKKFEKFPNFYNFENHQISIIDKLIK